MGNSTITMGNQEILRNKLDELYDLETPILIGVSGKFGSGKDTVADLICELHEEFTKKAFALRLKETVAAYTGTTLEMNMTQEGKLYKPRGGFGGRSLGKLQQDIGEGFKLLIDKNTWVDCAIDCEGLPQFLVMSDTRHKIEATAILKKGGYLIRVNGDPIGLRARILELNDPSQRDLFHSSETDLDDWDFGDCVIENNGSIEDLKVKLYKILSGWFIEK